MGFLNEFYNDYLMDNFTRAFKEYLKIKDPNQYELLYRNFLSGEGNETAQRLNWNLFKNVCQELVRIGYYSSIVTFMYGVFMHADKYNMKLFKEKLSEVKITDNLNLARLCSDFYLYVEKSYEWKEASAEISEELDLFEDEAWNYFNAHSYSPGNITELLPVFLMKTLYDKDIEIKVLDRECIDDVVKQVLKKQQDKIDTENAWILEHNKEMEEEEKQLNNKLHLPRAARNTVTEFDKKLIIPGTLLNIFKAAELSNKEDVCYYIQAEYVWKVFSIVPWERKRKIEVPFMGVLVEEYSEFIFGLELGRNQQLHLSNTNYSYTDQQFFKEMIGNGDGCLLEPGKNKYSQYDNIGIHMFRTLSRGKNAIKAEMKGYLYSFLMAFTPYILYCTGRVEEAAEFLVRYFDEINEDDKQRLYVQLILVRCILETKRIEEANTLYGYYNYEMDRQKRDKNRNTEFISEIIDYVYEVKEYIRQRNEYTFDSNESWFDILFGDGRIDTALSYIEKYPERGIIPPVDLFKQLMTYVEAFSYYSGIRLGLLGIPKQDNYDKLPDVLSQALIDRGQGYSSKYDEYLAFYQSLNQVDLRKNVNIFLQQRISKLLDNTINDSLLKIKELKETLSENKNLENEVDESILNNLENISYELTEKLTVSYLGREEIEFHIRDMQQNFIDTYRLDAADNLMLRLPLAMQADVNNYLVTSEIVYRVLAKRKDRDSLDFSPALIPLTKAMELVFNYIFNRMNIYMYSGMDTETKNSYFKGSNRKASIEFGPGVYLFTDSKYINVNKNNHEITFTEKNAYSSSSRFELWGGNEAVNIPELKKFSGLKIRINRWDKSINRYEEETATFNNDDKYNRLLYAKGLEYIKNNYRNIVAHKEGVSLQKVEECRELLLQTEHMLWILLFLLK